MSRSKTKKVRSRNIRKVRLKRQNDKVKAARKTAQAAKATTKK